MTVVVVEHSTTHMWITSRTSPPVAPKTLMDWQHRTGWASRATCPPATSLRHCPFAKSRFMRRCVDGVELGTMSIPLIAFHGVAIHVVLSTSWAKRVIFWRNSEWHCSHTSDHLATVDQTWLQQEHAVGVKTKKETHLIVRHRLCLNLTLVLAVERALACDSAGNQRNT